MRVCVDTQLLRREYTCIFPLLSVGLMKISHSRFKQYKNPLLNLMNLWYGVF